jgi:hypothetical protein
MMLVLLKSHRDREALNIAISITCTQMPQGETVIVGEKKVSLGMRSKGNVGIQ